MSHGYGIFVDNWGNVFITGTTSLQGGPCHLVQGGDVLLLRYELDTDSDGLSDVVEINVHGTDPNNSDTDHDGLSDADEVNVFYIDKVCDAKYHWTSVKR